MSTKKEGIRKFLLNVYKIVLLAYLLSNQKKKMNLQLHQIQGMDTLNI